MLCGCTKRALSDESRRVLNVGVVRCWCLVWVSIYMLCLCWFGLLLMDRGLPTSTGRLQAYGGLIAGFVVVLSFAVSFVS